VSTRPLRVGIVGSGPSCVYLVKELIQSDQPVSITIFESGSAAGVGTPYSFEQNPPYLLANIASIELPPVVESLNQFLLRSDERDIGRWGVVKDTISERTFYPRIAIGAYYADQLSQLQQLALSRGREVEIHLNHRVTDIRPGVSGTDIVSIATDEKHHATPHAKTFEKVVLATGHVVPTQRRFPSKVNLQAIQGKTRFGILGTSLSAIDIAVSLAMRFGTFTPEGYKLAEGKQALSIVMMSRGGLIPEADFYCPLPAKPFNDFREMDVVELSSRSPYGTVLDTTFREFARVLADADPAFAQNIDLKNLSADSFATAYFKERATSDPIEWSRRNLAEAKANASNRFTVPWRYAVLRSHEPFAACIPFLTDSELERFDAGLRRVFVDNYAAVPWTSIERLIALADSKILAVVRLGSQYSIGFDESNDEWRIDDDEGTIAVQSILDGRGAARATDQDFPFPTLRLFLQSNSIVSQKNAFGAVRVGPDYEFVNGMNPVKNIWCLSLPFLLGRQPFIQGLTSAEKLGRTAARGLLENRDVEPEMRIRDLVELTRATQPVVLDGGRVALLPRSAVFKKGRPDDH
jgi:uncharacterized NAD(P)/FAD-binding protein YdhS